MAVFNINQLKLWEVAFSQVLDPFRPIKLKDSLILLNFLEKFLNLKKTSNLQYWYSWTIDWDFWDCSVVLLRRYQSVDLQSDFQLNIIYKLLKSTYSKESIFFYANSVINFSLISRPSQLIKIISLRKLIYELMSSVNKFSGFWIPIN